MKKIQLLLILATLSFGAFSQTVTFPGTMQRTVDGAGFKFKFVGGLGTFAITDSIRAGLGVSQVQNSLTPSSTTLAPSVTAIKNALDLKSDVTHEQKTTGLTQGIASNSGVLVWIGDSFSVGAGATDYAHGVSSIVTQSIQNQSSSGNADGYGYNSIVNMQYQLSSNTGITTTGSLDNTGVVEKRLKLMAGQTITITNRTYKFADIIYDGALSSGSLTFRLNGNVVATKTISGSGLNSTFLTPVTSIETKLTDVVTITASSIVIVTSILTLKEPTYSPPITFVVAQAATLFSDYSTSAKMDEIAYYLDFAARQRRYVALALGTNSLYNPSYRETPSAMIANAQALISGINARSTVPVNYILTVPAKANETYYPTLPGYSYEDYVKAIVEYGKLNDYEVIRYDLTVMGSGSDNYLDDHLHPNNVGHSVIANAWTDKLNIPTNPNPATSIRNSGNGVYLPLTAGNLSPLTGPLSLNSPESNTVGIASGIDGYILSTPNGYSGFRQSTDKAFNIDTYNLGAPINALKLSQAGVLSIAGSPTNPTDVVRLQDLTSKTLFDYYTDASNSGTTETGLYSGTVSAGQLSANGDKLEMTYAGNFGTDAIANKNIRVRFAGNEIFSTGYYNTTGNGYWSLKVLIIRTGATDIRVTSTFTATPNSSQTNYTLITSFTGITLSSSAILKLTAEAGSTGQLVGKLGTVQFKKGA